MAPQVFAEEGSANRQAISRPNRAPATRSALAAHGVIHRRAGAAALDRCSFVEDRRAHRSQHISRRFTFHARRAAPPRSGGLMTFSPSRALATALILVALLASLAVADTQAPAARKAPVTDTYFGTSVTD